MPLRAIGNGKDYISYELAPDEWTALKGKYRSMGLRMPCCDNSAIPKTSKLGTQFFSHARRGDCTSGPETPEHLLGKSIIAMAAQSVGWKVTPEFRGTGNRGESWIADVMCQRGKASVAFEMQWSPQTEEETKKRQAIYASSNVRALWFMRVHEKPRFDAPPLIEEESTPVFGIKYVPEGHSFVIPRFNLPLGEFVKKSLGGDLYWGPNDGDPCTVAVHLHKWRCDSCREYVGVPATITLRDGNGVELGACWFTERGVSKIIESCLNPDLMRNYKVGEIQHRVSENGRTYRCNTCFFCGRVVPRFEYHEFYPGDLYSRAIASTTIILGKDLPNTYGAWHLRSTEVQKTVPDPRERITGSPP